MDTILKNSNYAGLGEADSKDSGLELEGYYGFLLGVIPDNDLQKAIRSALWPVISRMKVVRYFVRIWGFFHRPPEQGNYSDQAVLSRLSQH